MYNELKQCLACALTIAKTYNTFEIGELTEICKIIEEDSSILQGKHFDTILYDFIVSFSEESRKNSISIEHLSLIIVQSLIFNIYTRHNKNMSNSFYNTSSMLSTSQVSMSASEHSMRMDFDEFQNYVVSFVEDFTSNEKVLKKFKFILDRHHNKNQNNQRYL